jgi:hypothetical protein
MTKMILPAGVKLFVDSDGVFAHFERNVEDMFGYHPDDMDDDHMWELITQHKDVFWPKMPLMEDAERLWEFVRPLNPTVLTGCNKSHFDEAAAFKREWWAKPPFNYTNVITCLAKEKPLHMVNKGDWLLDDFVANTKRWEKAGGVGILHADVESTIEKLTAMLVPEIV